MKLIDAVAIISGLMMLIIWIPSANSQSTIVIGLVAIGIFNISAEISGLYRSWRGIRFEKEAICSVIASVITIIMLSFLGHFSLYSTELSGGSLALWFSDCCSYFNAVNYSWREFKKRSNRMISVQQLLLRQGDFELSQVSFEIPLHAYAILMGATGSGKTTLLESICGLRRISGGKIFLDGDEITRTPPAQRQIGYVPQDSSLFPTMKVHRQIAFGMEVRGFSQAERSQRVEELASSLDITEILDRYPRGLSGGEKQRVALARALSFRPRLLCLDEPLSALDGETRSNLTKLLKKIQQSESVTVLHITHNVEEGVELGTVHFRLEKGEVRAVACKDSGDKNTA